MDSNALPIWLRTPVPARQGELPQSAAEWRTLADQAARTGLAGLVLEAANRHGWRIPPWIEPHLRVSACKVASENLHFLQALERVVGTLGDAGVPAMLLKGAALNLSLYSRPDLRPMSDIDVIVPLSMALGAVEALTLSVCRRGFPLIRRDFFPTYHYELELWTNDEPAVRIDLHARPLRPLRLARIMPDDALWRNAATVPVGQAAALIPRPEAMFVHLAAHATFHGCSRLIWLYDLIRLARDQRAQLDWDGVVRLAQEWRLAGAVGHAVKQAQQAIEEFCPPHILSRLLLTRSNWRDRLMLRQTPHDAASPVTNVLCNLLCTPGVRFKAGYLAAMLTPGEEHLAQWYHRRHRGWTLFAHGRRIQRRLPGLGRLVPASG